MQECRREVREPPPENWEVSIEGQILASLASARRRAAVNGLRRLGPRLGFIGMAICLRSDHADPSRLLRAGLSPNHDFDVLVKRRQQVHQAFDGEARQLVVTQRRDLRLRYP